MFLNITFGYFNIFWFLLSVWHFLLFSSFFFLFFFFLSSFQIVWKMPCLVNSWWMLYSMIHCIIMLSQQCALSTYWQDIFWSIFKGKIMNINKTENKNKCSFTFRFWCLLEIFFLFLFYSFYSFFIYYFVIFFVPIILLNRLCCYNYHVLVIFYNDF